MAETINVKNLNKTYDGKTMILEDFRIPLSPENFMRLWGVPGQENRPC